MKRVFDLSATSLTFSLANFDGRAVAQEDVNGEKANGEKNGGFLVLIFSRFGADFFTVYADFSRFCKGHKR